MTRPPIALAVIVSAFTLALLGCGSDSAVTPSETTTSTTTVAPASTTSSTTSTAAPVVVTIDESSFRNVNDLTAIRGFYVDNLLGDLDATVAVAEQVDGGTYPTGSLVQLLPTEAMVKREPGFSPATNDWEFFELVVDADGTEIRVRGGADVVNSFGVSCAECHLQAEPQYDLICEQDHGCAPLAIGPAIIDVLQAGDPRPRR